MVLTAAVKLPNSLLRTKNQDSSKSCKMQNFCKILNFLKIALAVDLLTNFDIIMIPCNIPSSCKVSFCNC